MRRLAVSGQRSAISSNAYFYFEQIIEIRELIKDGENGFIVKKGNLKELVSKINYVLFF